jgi:hypothetical protein
MMTYIYPLIQEPTGVIVDRWRIAPCYMRTSSRICIWPRIAAVRVNDIDKSLQLIL